MDGLYEPFLDSEAVQRARESIALREKTLSQDALRLLAEEVITRLAQKFSPRLPKFTIPSVSEIDALADALVADDAEEASNFILSLRAQGVPRDTIYLGYMAGASRRLGERWERDELPFTDVTIGAGRLYVIMRAMRPTFVSRGIDGTRKGPTLFASVPGEIHTLGITMATEYFREHNWDVDLKTGLCHEELIDIVSTREYLVIGLSASSQRMTLPLARLIASLRVVSPVSAIMISGELTVTEPELVRLVDADSKASDVQTALVEMQRLLNQVLSGNSNEACG